jgi:serine phosphatase RsbU (regulator of sigma subunit)
MLGTLGLRTRIAVVVVVGALLVAAGVTLLLLNTVSLRNGSAATLRGEAYLVSVIRLERDVIDAETGLRGYVITGRRLFLAPTRVAQAQFPEAVRALRQAAARDGDFRPQAQKLIEAAQAFMSGYLVRVAAATGPALQRDRSFATTLAGKQMVDAVRVRTASLEGLVSARESARQRSARRSASAATTEAVAVLVLVTLLILGLGLLLGRLVVDRERARARSEETTATLRQSLLPARLPSIPDCEVAVRFLPASASELVGGDFYDVFPVGDDRWAVVVGDVCGKGSAAAALTAMARWTLRSLAGSPVAPDDALRFLNRSMLRLDLNGRFITIAYLLLTAGKTETYGVLACAGHPPGLFVPAEGDTTPLPARGTVLGIWPEITVQTSEVRLGPGDAVLLYTDGVSDPGPGPPPQLDHALDERRRGADAEDLARALERSVDRVVGPVRDDIAIVAVRRREPTENLAPAVTASRAGSPLSRNV